MHRIMLILACTLSVLAFLGLAGWFFLPATVWRDLANAIERQRAGLVAGTVLINGRPPVAILDGGPAGDAAPILLVHGSSGEKDNWTRVARLLTPHRRVIAIDLPGFGASPRWTDQGDGLQDQFNALATIIEALGLQQIHIGGNSMGGRLAALYAATQPQRVRSLWLLGPGGVLSAQPSDLMRHLQTGADNPLFIRSTAAYDAYLHWLMPSPPRIPAPVKRAMAAQAVQKADFHRGVFDAIAAETLSLEQAVAGMNVPTRIVWGERDRIWHVSGAALLLDHLPQASLLLLPGGHLPMIEAPDIVAADYLAFLSSLSSN